MNKIGNIIAINNIVYDDAFNKVNDIKFIDASLPTLIIGLDNAKKVITDFNILNKKYGNIYWTFKKTERRDDYENDLKTFYDICITNIVKDVKYNYINFINYRINRIKSLINYIYSNSIKYYFVMPNKNFIFIYDKNSKVVMGLSLSLCEYVGLKKDKILNKLSHNNSMVKVNGNFIFSDLIKPYINNDPHYILPLYEYFNR